jgi:hypothetical protein
MFAAAALVFAWGCGKEKHGQAKEQGHEEGHVAVHGGCLNAIETCENGHAEIKVEETTLKLWFVNGGSETDRAVRIPDKEVALAVTLEGEKEAKTITLKAKPSALAEEKEGDCSHFEGSADWLRGVKNFVATGSVTFKGKKQEIRIEYPAGYDPD